MKIKPLFVVAVYGLWLLAAAVFLAVAAYYLLNFGVEPLSRDQWHMYAQMFEQGLLNTSLSTVSGHRHFFAFSLFWLDWHYFAASNQLLLLCAWLLNGLLLGLIVRVVWRDSPLPLLLAGTVVLMGFWLINLALLGWGFNGINNYLSIVPSIWGLYWLARAAAMSQADIAHWQLALAAICGLVASVSFGNGVVVWPAGVLLLWAVRARWPLLAWWLAAAVLALAGYFLLPGGEAVNHSLLFNGWYTLRYPFEQLGGPLWHALRSVPALNSAAVMQLAKMAGYVIGALSLGYLSWQIVGRRLQGSSLRAVSCALQLMGWGTLLLLTITRPQGMLDIAIDRFQIWALLIWLGLLIGLWSVTAWRRVVLPLALIFPVAALPSQLDWGARLAEYNNRTAQSLLSWMIELPVAGDAERALHWNWQQKIMPLQQVLDKARSERANLFRQLPAVALAEQLPPLPACEQSVSRVRQLPILQNELLRAEQVYSAPQGEVVGWRLFAQFDWRSQQRVALMNSARQIVGFALPIEHSQLPRTSGMRQGGYSLYAVSKWAEPPVRLAVYDADRTVCEIALTAAD